jgi:hypothetical protein
MARLEVDRMAGLDLEQAKVQRILRAAIIRHGDAEADAPSALDLQEALAIAAELSIPAEQVQAAYTAQLETDARQQRRSALRETLQRRQRKTAAMMGGLALFLGLQFLWIDPHNFPIHLLLLLPFVLLAFFMARMTVSDEQLDRAELLPVPGVCRICSRPAHSAAAIYCARHRR